jgi:transposase
MPRLYGGCSKEVYPRSWTKTFWVHFMRKTNLSNRRHPVSEKLQLVQQYDSGTPVRVLSAKTGIHRAQIRQWIHQYQVNGIEGFSMKKQPHPAPLKLEIVSKIIQDGLSLQQASIDYRITYSVIQEWVNKAKSQGVEALFIDNRGRCPKKFMNKKPKKITGPLSRDQELLMENERLSAENTYLKKLKALVEERIARERGSVHKPSGN